jgi:hypothetical protein
VALLRVSSQAKGEEAELSGAVGEGDGGVPHGGELLRFAEAATRGSEDLVAARAALIEAVGGAAFVLTAATVGIFNGLVRTADSIGIPLDEMTAGSSGAFRDELGLNAFPGRRNTHFDSESGERVGD